MRTDDSGRDAIVAFIKHAEATRPGVTADEIARFLANAADKRHVYEIKGLPVPADLTDDEVAGIHFERKRTPGDA